VQQGDCRVEESWSFASDGVSESVTCTLLNDDDDTRQRDNTGTLPSFFSFSSLGAGSGGPQVMHAMRRNVCQVPVPTIDR